MEAIRELIHNGGVFTWDHIFRETNQVADALEQYGLSVQGNTKLFDFCPSFLNSFLTANVIGTHFPRGF